MTGKQYIGTSVNPISHRISRHVYAAKKGNRSRMAIADAILKYGIDNFSIEQIGESSDYESLLQMEAEAISQFNTRVPNGYNITAGGRGGRRPCSQETRDLISNKMQGKKPWNYGIGPTSRIAHPHRASGIGGPDKGSKPWNFGKKMGPLPEDVKSKIAEGVRRVRATRFWSNKRNPILVSREAI
jgi:group I intron endonuclease